MSLERGVITSQMGGRSTGAVNVQRDSTSRLPPHLYYALTTCLCAWGGAVTTGGLEVRNCTVMGGPDRKGGGVIMSLNYFRN